MNMPGFCALSALFLAAVLAPLSAHAQQHGEIRIMAIPPQSLARADTGLTPIAGYELTGTDPRFGGLSGLAVRADGRALLAVGDRGLWVSMDLAFEDGVPVPTGRVEIAPLLGPDGLPLEGADADAESLRMDGESALVSFERHHRILRYAPDASGSFLASPGHALALPPDIGDQKANNGIEAFLRLADGRLLLFSEERSGSGNPAWLCCGAGEDGYRFTIGWPGPHVPTDAARLEAGDMFVLLRHFSPADGVSARLLRLPQARFDGRPGPIDAGSAGSVLLTLEPPHAVDNMEGLAILERLGSKPLLFLLSDDNFSPLQRTLLLVYRLE